MATTSTVTVSDTVELVTEITDAPRYKHVAGIVTRNGVRVGTVVSLGRTFRASRTICSPTDMRRVSTGFRSPETAAAWIRDAYLAA